jgi:hypothetical protein
MTGGANEQLAGTALTGRDRRQFRRAEPADSRL